MVLGPSCPRGRKFDLATNLPEGRELVDWGVSLFCAQANVTNHMLHVYTTTQKYVLSPGGLHCEAPGQLGTALALTNR